MKTASSPSDPPEIELQTAGLCLRFWRAGDRFRVQSQVGPALLFDTALSGPEEAWPAAPPLQQLHEQVLPTGPVVLGVGSAGTTHWSASFAAKEPGVIWCEYAARVSRTWDPASQWLGTRFQISEGWELSAAENGLKLSNRSQQVLLLALGPESQLSANGPDALSVAPAKDFVQRTNTIQWRLAVCFR